MTARKEDSPNHSYILIIIFGQENYGGEMKPLALPQVQKPNRSFLKEKSV